MIDSQCFSLDKRVLFFYNLDIKRLVIKSCSGVCSIAEAENSSTQKAVRVLPHGFIRLVTFAMTV